MSKIRFLSRSLGCVLLFMSGATYAAEFEQAWQTPVQIDLPAPERTIVLRRDVDVEAWLEKSALSPKSLERMRLTRIGRQTLVQTQVPDQEWAEVESQTCGGSDVVSCGSSSCQSIQFQSQVGQSQHPQKLKARIVPKQRDLELPDPAADEHMCRMAAVPVLGDAAEAGRELVLDIPDLEVGESTAQAKTAEVPASEPVADAGPAVESAPSVAESEPSEAASSPSEATPGEPTQGSEPIVARKVIQLAVSQLGTQPSFAAQDLPADTSDYDLLVGEGCREVRIPLESIEPAHVPGRLVAVVGAADVDAVATSYGLTVIESTELASRGEQLVVYATSQELLSTLAMLAFDSRVTASQKEFVYTTIAETPVYSDTYARFSYGPEITGALGLHAETQGANQVVAVIDTGVAIDHPDLVDRVETANFTDYEFAAEAHGTAVAGIIAAAANNAVGTYGVAPAAKIQAFKACHPVSEGSMRAKCWSSTLVKSIDAAIQSNASVINMSLAGPPDPMVKKYVEEALAQGALIVAGAGNGGPSAKPAFPAAIPGVISVTAVDSSNRLYDQANLGGYIDVAAPGVDIVTPTPNGGYPVSSGTSWAAAHVSGIVVLLKDLVPFLSASEIAGALATSATDLGEVGSDTSYGSGLVNACSAASLATADAIGCGEADEN